MESGEPTRTTGSSGRCPRCGATLGGFAPEGLCGGCLLGDLSTGEILAADPDPLSGPRRFGDYELLGEIARGGMGVVYRARQVSLDRVVALKMILSGEMAGAGEVLRFRQEAEAAARLKHPNIVAIHEVGEHDGRHYFSMDFIEGRTLRELTLDSPMSASDAATSLELVAEAVQYAHEQGVVHRDLKPGNVLVDAAGQPHVTDFGLAKRLGSDAELTRSGDVMGTPGYMPPEQAGGRTRTVGPLADVYALGAMLYDLLTGRPPFRGETPLETLAQVMNTEPVAPRLLNAGVPRDLETICLKCLEKDPARRYPSARELALDLRRFRNHEPIHAAPPSTVYRAGKFVRRHRMAVAVAACFIGVLIAASVVSVTYGLRAERHRKQAEKSGREESQMRQQAEGDKKTAQTEAARSWQIAEFLKDMLNGVEPSVALGRDTTLLREIMDRTAARVTQDLAHQPAVQAELCHILGEMYREIGEYAKAEAQARQALAIRKPMFGPQSSEVGASLYSLGFALGEQRKWEEAERVQRQALDIHRRLSPPGGSTRELAQSLNNLAMLLNRRGQAAESEAFHREALRMRREVFGNVSPAVANSLNNLGSFLRMDGRLVEAESMLREALAVEQKLGRTNHPYAAFPLGNLGLLLMESGRVTEGEAMVRTALETHQKMLGPRSAVVADVLNQLAVALRSLGRFADSEALARQGLDIRRQWSGEKTAEAAGAMRSVATAVEAQGRITEALALLREALELTRKAYPPGHREIARSLDYLAKALQDHGQWAEAEASRREALGIWRQSDTSEVAQALGSLGSVLMGQNKLMEAETVCREALGIERGVSPQNPGGLATALNALGTVFYLQRKFAEAEPLHREALTLRRQIHGTNTAEIATSLHNLAAAFDGQGKFAEAEPIYREALATRQKLWPGDPLRWGRTIENLAGGLVQEGKFDQAEKIFSELPVPVAKVALQKLVDIQRQTTGVGSQRLAFTKALLGQLLLREGEYRAARPHLEQALDVLRKRQAERPSEPRAQVIQQIVRNLAQLSEAEKAK